ERWRSRLTFDTLEDRSLPAVPFPVAGVTEFPVSQAGGALTPRGSAPRDMTRGGGGGNKFYINDPGSGKKGSVAPHPKGGAGATVVFNTPNLTGAPLQQGLQPHTDIPGPDGNIWFTCLKDNIGKLDLNPASPTFNQVVLFNNGITAGAVPHTPVFVGNDLWWTEENGSKIAMLPGAADPVTPATPATPIQEFNVAANSGPHGMVFNPNDGLLWYTIQDGDGIGNFNPTTHVFTEFKAGIPANAGPLDCVLGPELDGSSHHKFLYFTEQQSNRLGRFDFSTHTTTQIVTDMLN